MKKNFVRAIVVVIIGALVLGIIAGMIYFAYLNIRFDLFEDYTSGVKIRYPKGWELQENTTGALAVFVSPQAISYDMFKENVSIVVQDLPPRAATLEEYTDLAISQFTAVFGQNGVKTVESKATSLDGHPAYRFSYVIELNLMLKLTHVWFLKDGKSYQLNFICETDNCEKNKVNFWVMQETFSVH